MGGGVLAKVNCAMEKGASHSLECLYQRYFVSLEGGHQPPLACPSLDYCLIIFNGIHIIWGASAYLPPLASPHYTPVHGTSTGFALTFTLLPDHRFKRTNHCRSSETENRENLSNLRKSNENGLLWLLDVVRHKQYSNILNSCCLQHEY